MSIVQLAFVFLVAGGAAGAAIAIIKALDAWNENSRRRRIDELNIRIRQ